MKKDDFLIKDNNNGIKKNTRSSKANKKRNQKRNQKLKITLMCLFLLLLFFIGFGAYYFINTINKIDRDPINDSNAEIGISDDSLEKFQDKDYITNIALFGIDSRSNDFAGRSDSVIVFTIDKENNKLKLTSLMRDSYVNIDGHGKDKLTHAYAYGGAQLAVRTLNENFKLNIKDYVTVDFSGLINIIDALKGIDITIRSDEVQYINQYIDELSKIEGVSPSYIKEAGSYHLNGIQAVAYTRIRYTSGGDYERTERQRIVLEQIFQKVKDTSLTNLPSLVSSLPAYVRTSLTSSEILSLGTSVLTSGVSNLEQVRFPLDKDAKGGLVGGVWYLQFNEQATIDAMYNYIFDDMKP